MVFTALNTNLYFSKVSEPRNKESFCFEQHLLYILDGMSVRSQQVLCVLLFTARIAQLAIYRYTIGRSFNQITGNS